MNFDELKLKDVDGQQRTFFPGEPDKQNWVPIGWQESSSNVDDKMKRKQFPLTLAWAITHWKAQGMTLPRARVQLSAKVAGEHGVGFVACTRVRHPTHMVFEDDLPEWEAFQGVRDTATFHRRRRFELRLQAKASETIRRYGFFAHDLWSEEEAVRAGALLKNLEAVREDQRAKLKNTGRRAYLSASRPDRDAYLWGNEPDYVALLDDAARTLGGTCAGNVDAEIAAYRRVKDKLLTDLHMPAVKEALGALIPEWLHWSQDDPKRRGKKNVQSGKRVGVNLTASGWKIDVFVEGFARPPASCQGYYGVFSECGKNYCWSTAAAFVCGITQAWGALAAKHCEQRAFERPRRRAGSAARLALVDALGGHDGAEAVATGSLV